EYFCDGNKAYTAKVDYKWIKCESYQVCTDGACKNSYFGPTEFDEEDKSAKKTGKPNSPLQGIFVSPDGYAKYDTYESFCVKAEGPNFSYKVANGLNPDFFGEKGKAIRPEIYVYFEKLVCMWGCNGNGTRTDKNLDTNKGLCKPNPNVDTEMHIKKSSGRFMKFWNSFKKK
ncbi:hypothetical protein KKA47_00975, partial [bacterium]|nr:hypothetical protein [bacterium]